MSLFDNQFCNGLCQTMFSKRGHTIHLNGLSLQEVLGPSHLIFLSYGVLQFKFIYKTTVMSHNQTAAYLFENVFLACQPKSSVKHSNIFNFCYHAIFAIFLFMLGQMLSLTSISGECLIPPIRTWSGNLLRKMSL